MEDLIRDYWWLVFPIGGFAFAAAGMVMHAQMQRDRLQLLKTYAEKGMTPPPELTSAATLDPDAEGWRMSRRERRHYRRMRYGPGGLIVPAVIAAVFLGVAFSNGDGRPHWAFLLVGLIMAAVTVAAMLSTMVGAVWFDRRPR